MVAPLLSVLIICVVGNCGAASDNKGENESSYWQRLGRYTLDTSIQMTMNEGIAKNVIFFLGDGMGPSTVTAMRIYKGQKNGETGTVRNLAFEQFPHVSLVKTYSLDKMVADSASTATAFFCGVKANWGTLGVNGQVKFDDCKSSRGPLTRATSIMQWAQNSHKRTGFVTTKRVTDATPAALYSHTANRHWESSSPDPQCEDIASQLINNRPGEDINVIFGGGWSSFLPNTVRDSHGVLGERTDKKDLIQQWIKSKKDYDLKASYIDDYDKFTRMDPAEIDYVLGLFNATNLPFVLDRPNSERTPSLAQMTRKAIEVLDKGYIGYMLVVEGAKIDSAHHENSAKKALEEGLEFEEAIATALEMANHSDTLIVVTADHSHPFVISGDYPLRNQNILGLGGNSNITGQPMTVLSYANGPGYKQAKEDLKESDVVTNNYKQDATYPMQKGTHGGEDVAVYTLGPMAHLFHGVQEQSYLAYAVGYAACIGPNAYQYGRCRMMSSSNHIKADPGMTLLCIGGLVSIIYMHIIK